MKIIQSSYYVIALTLIFSSMVVNIVWRSNEWPDYFTFCSFLILLSLRILIWIDDRKQKERH
ncbi:hypothetical protein C1N61_29755 (plasmid) [Priestia aryabhattai]